MASNGAWTNTEYEGIWRNSDGRLVYSDGRPVKSIDRECVYVLMSIFPIFFLNFIIYGVGSTYDDLSEAGPIFWSKLTLYILSLI